MSLSMWDKQKQMGLILKRKRDGDGKSPEMTPMKNEEVKTEDGEVDPKHLAAEDMLAAFHEKSPHKLRQAMENFVDLHMHKQESEPKPKE